jgi:hypothetical protein
MLKIRCAFCGTINNVDESKRFKAVCGKCKHSLAFSLDTANVNEPADSIPDDCDDDLDSYGAPEDDF